MFFFKQKTAYEMRISDWSSDVCSSDLRSPPPRNRRHPSAAACRAPAAAPRLPNSCRPGHRDHRGQGGRGGSSGTPETDFGRRQRARIEQCRAEKERFPSRSLRRRPTALGSAAAARYPVDRLQGNEGRDRRVGKECVSTCRSRWSPDTYKKNIKKKTY